MTIPSGNNLFVELTQLKEAGTPWVVRLYRKTLFFKKNISTDWFLNEQQAKTFAERLAQDLRDGGSLTNITQRKPGWTLHRAPR